MSRKKGYPPGTACIFCGSTNDVTKDHVPPKGLFPKGIQGVKVPSCRTCNGSMSADEEYFRSRLIPNVDIADSPEAREVMGTLLRSLGRPDHVGMARGFLKSVFMMPVHTPGGLYLGHARAYRPDEERMNRVLEKVVKGLFFDEMQRPLSPDFSVRVVWPYMLEKNPQDEHIAKARALVHKLVAGPRRRFGNVFGYAAAAPVREKPDHTVWLLMFYTSVWFACETAPKSLTSKIAG